MFDDLAEMVFPNLTEVDPPPQLSDAGPKDRMRLIAALLEDKEDCQGHCVDLFASPEGEKILESIVFAVLTCDTLIDQTGRIADYIKREALAYEDETNEALTDLYDRKTDD